MWLRLLAERRFREGEKRPSEYLVMLPQSGSWAFGVKKLMGVSHSSKIGRANPVPILYSERPPAFDCVSSCVRTCLVPRSVVPRPAFAKKYRDCRADALLLGFQNPENLCAVLGQIAWRHSNKRCCANIRWRSEAKHCSSLCSQSELQCWRRNRRLCGPTQISVVRHATVNI